MIIYDTTSKRIFWRDDDSDSDRELSPDERFNEAFVRECEPHGCEFFAMQNALTASKFLSVTDHKLAGKLFARSYLEGFYVGRKHDHADA